MSSLFFAVLKCREASTVRNVGSGVSAIRRGCTVAVKSKAIRTIHTSRLGSLLTKASVASTVNCRSLAVSSLRHLSIKANIDADNVLSSPFPDVHGFNGVYLHEFICRDWNKWPDKTAAQCATTGRRYTYAQLRKMSGRLATSLRRSNIAPGETIAVVLPNVPEYVLLVLAASEAGLRATLMNPAYTVNEMRAQLKNSEASAIFTVPSKHATVAASIVGNRNVKLPIIVIEDGSGSVPSGCINFKDLVKDDVEEFEKTGEKTGTDTEDTILLPYSSGTSGLQKGVELTHRNLVANMMQVLTEHISRAVATTDTHQEIVPLVLPLYHIYGLLLNLNHYLCIGSKIVMLPQFSADNMFKILEENRSTFLYLAPPLVQLLANDERLRHRHLEAVKSVVSGAAPISKDVLEKFRSRTPEQMVILQGYGLTETSPILCFSKDAPVESCGFPVSNTQIRIVGTEGENAGKNLGIDEVGELWVRGPQIMKGYYKNQQATADCMDGEWFKTGDLGCYNEEGLIFISGRLKELIKVKGFQVAPAEIEHLIQAHDKVADAAVIGVAHEKFGEIPKAFVVPKKGVKLEQSEIKDYVAERVAKHKQLGHVEFIEVIPKSAAGKILRRVLQKM